MDAVNLLIQVLQDLREREQGEEDTKRVIIWPEVGLKRRQTAGSVGHVFVVPLSPGSFVGELRLKRKKEDVDADHLQLASRVADP